MNWWQKIDMLEKAREQDRSAVLNRFYDEACDWVTCACGQQDYRIPRVDDVPNDGQLRALGAEFPERLSEGWEDGDFTRARTTLAKIELRAGEIIAEIEAKAPTPELVEMT